LGQQERSPHTAARTLKEIYKHCKTTGGDDEDEESEEDEESLQRANELF